MSRFRFDSRIIMWSVFSNVKHKLQIFSHIQYLYKHTHTEESLPLSRLLSDYFTVGLIIERYTSTYFLSINEVSAKSTVMLEFGNFTAL
jgi:hypothetical protein